MNRKHITPAVLKRFAMHLTENERSRATIAKYMHDVRCFISFAQGRPLTRETVLAYKEKLAADYAPSSANSMLSALNALWRFMHLEMLCVKQFKLQRKLYTPEEKELRQDEYRKLVAAARRNNDRRTELILQSICATGMRVSELQYLTVEALNAREVHVRCKGKTRSVFLTKALCRLLQQYAKQRGITAGPVFVTRRGTPVNRTSIWRTMKALCHSAGVLPQKVFPHNLRHLFARTFYRINRDIAKLADLLGHSSINTTRIYITATGAEHKILLERLNLLIGNQKTLPPATAEATT